MRRETYAGQSRCAIKRVGELLDRLRERGFTRLLVGDDGVPFESVTEAPAGEVSVLVDRVKIRSDARSRLVDSVETAFAEGGGAIWAKVVGGPRLRFSADFECSRCARAFEEPQPSLFSFNNPQGACPTCHGSGRASSSRTMQVRIPAGVRDGQRIRLRGKGASGEGGGPNGDLYVVVHVDSHPVFGRKADNLTVTAPVTIDEAALGAQIKVPTLGGTPVTLKIPPGTPNGRVFRVRGRGVTRKDGTRGDLLVTVEVSVPAELSAEAKAALEAFIFEWFRPRPFNTHLSLVLDTLTSIQERLADLDQDTRHDAE